MVSFEQPVLSSRKSPSAAASNDLPFASKRARTSATGRARALTRYSAKGAGKAGRSTSASPQKGHSSRAVEKVIRAASQSCARTGAEGTASQPGHEGRTAPSPPIL